MRIGGPGKRVGPTLESKGHEPAAGLRVLDFMVSILGVVLVGVVDWWSGYELNFFVFYFAPVAYAAWRLGAALAFVTAVLSGFVWFMADWCSGHSYSSHFFAYWNTALRTFSFLVIAYGTNRIRRLTEDAQRAAQRLGGLLPICAWCKKIRTDSGYWDQVEHYFQEHSVAEFTHSICDDCAQRMEAEASRLGGQTPGTDSLSRPP